MRYETIICVLLPLLVQSCGTYAQIKGCTDPLAVNYNESATFNDGSCLYDPDVVAPDTSFLLSDILHETSGLILWNNHLWTHNDNSDRNIYALNPNTGNINRNIPIRTVNNTDWEEISQDNRFIYIGDIGNNARGNRKDLHILRIEKSSLSNTEQRIDTIAFYYPEQDSFPANQANNTDFDCEAFIVSEDSIYLFTKQWLNLQTALYAIPNQPGSHTAQYKETWNVEGLVTGATYLPEKKLIALCGYNSLLQPFIYLLYDFKGNDFFSGNKRKINLNLPFHQVEGIATTDGLQYYLTNEVFSRASLKVPPQLHIVRLNAYLEQYLNPPLTIGKYNKRTQKMQLFPNPAKEWLQITVPDISSGADEYSIINTLGTKILTGKLKATTSVISLQQFSSGVYYIILSNGISKAFQIL